ncbi:tetratricopeptide repeat protein [Bernardetia sp. Wsw4-3y2]|uniref:tetratricopeptide repeat protein n=1 Tax=Bernardetia sp. Wsw4-3y2 TaxID=3127471 RepID=UPI0030D5D813
MTFHYMQRNHTVYMGEDDNFDYWSTNIKKMYEQADVVTLLEMEKVKGNHFTSLKPSMELFIEKIEAGEENKNSNEATEEKVVIDDNFLEGIQLYQKAKTFYDDENFQEAIPYLEEAAKKGHEGAQFDLGYLYKEGKGTKQDNEKSLFWFKEAAKQESAMAQMAVASIYLVDKNYNEGFKWTKLAAQQGVVEAQYYVGMMYLEGKGTTKNYTEAIKWHKEAIKSNHAEAMFSLGALYAQGIGVKKNKDEAFRLMNKAYKINPNVPEHAYYLGVMYMYGDGVERNPDTAISLMQKAARKGFKPAQEHLKDIDKTW